MIYKWSGDFFFFVRFTRKEWQKMGKKIQLFNSSNK